MANEILVNVNRCTGCWTCSQACKAAFDLDVDDYRLIIRTIGGGGIDKAGGTWPNLYMKWNPIFNLECTRCSGDESTGNVPYCVYNCPCDALYYGDPEDPNSTYAKKKEQLLDKGFHTWDWPEWEKNQKGITYIEKGI